MTYHLCSRYVDKSILEKYVYYHVGNYGDPAIFFPAALEEKCCSGCIINNMSDEDIILLSLKNLIHAEISEDMFSSLLRKHMINEIGYKTKCTDFSS